jgi:Fur family transcriptional regulator, peroxide stress response regulator
MITKCSETKEKLVRCGVKSTHQRMRILESLQKMGHPDAKKVYLFLVREMPSLSKTTVYNTLDALHRAGLVSVLSIAGEGTRYELAGEPHCHFVCRKCGKIIDMSFSCRHADSLRLDGYVVEELLGCFKGVCKACQARDANRPRKGRRSAVPKTRQQKREVR